MVLHIVIPGGNMNDFLKNLRSTQKGSQQKPSLPTRKEIGERYQTGNERRNILDRRGPLHPPPQSQYKEPLFLQESIPAIMDHLTTIVSTVERMVERQESLIKVQMEQQQAVGSFFTNLNQILMERIVPALPNAVSPEPIQKGTTSYASGTHHTKDEVIAMIRSMREKRSTFAEIAQALMEKGIPTFSGRGDWHAQTIHRLCK